MKDLQRQFLSMFIDMAQVRLTRAQEQIERNDVTAFASGLHALAGEAGVLGYIKVAKDASKAETIARASIGSSVAVECSAILKRIVECVRDMSAEQDNSLAVEEAAN